MTILSKEILRTEDSFQKSAIDLNDSTISLSSEQPHKNLHIFSREQSQEAKICFPGYKQPSLPSQWKSKNTRCGLVYDKRMLLHKCVNRPHMERPERISYVLEKLQKEGIINQLKTIQPRLASFEELRSAHTKQYLRKLFRLISSKPTIERLKDFAEEEFEDIFLNEHTILAAMLAAGCAIAAVEAVVHGEVSNSFALVRPPGHHAEAHCGMGFCIFNNVVVCTKYAINKLKLQRVLIVDWDVHHGNGTQRAFIDDERVLYFSAHRYDLGKFYPCGDGASHEFVGYGKAAGKNINICWNGKGFSDADYLAVWEYLLLPVAKQFNPELIIVSAGFDAAAGENSGDCMVTPEGFGRMTTHLKKLCKNVVMVLEGGYNLSSLASCVHKCVHELSIPVEEKKEEPVDIKKIKPQAISAINTTIDVHSKYWDCLRRIDTTC